MRFEVDRRERALRNWEEIVEQEIDEPPTDRDLERLAKLCLRVRRGKFAIVSEQQVRARELADQARSLILSTPGHASHFQQKISKNREAILAGTMGWSPYSSSNRWNFNLLSVMPSHDTVLVLTDFLGDRRGGDPRKPAKRFPGQLEDEYVSNASHAVRALSEIGLADPPETDDPTLYATAPWALVEMWQEWWAEVENGERTFRFEDDPQHYNHLGPVEGPPSGSATRLSPGERVDDPSGDAGNASTREAEERSSASNLMYWLALVIPAAVIIALLARASSRKRTRE